MASLGIDPSTTRTNGSSSPRSALKNHSMKSSAPPTGPHSKSISGQCTAILGKPGQGAERDLLDARLGRRGQGDGVPVAAEPGVDPQDVDDRLVRWQLSVAVNVPSPGRGRAAIVRLHAVSASCRPPVNECLLHRPLERASAVRPLTVPACRTRITGAWPRNDVPRGRRQPRVLARVRAGAAPPVHAAGDPAAAVRAARIRIRAGAAAVEFQVRPRRPSRRLSRPGPARARRAGAGLGQRPSDRTGAPCLRGSRRWGSGCYGYGWG